MIGFLYAVGWFLAAAFPLTDSDIWWHLASAREMFLQCRLLDADPFTFTAQGVPWSNVHWLYQILIYASYRVAGEWGGLGIHAIAWGVAAWIWNRGKSNANLFLIGLICIIGTRYLLLARPIVFTLLIIGIQIRIWESNWEWKKKLWALGVMQILLSNMQGLFLLGPFFLFAWMWKEGYKGRQLWSIPTGLVLVSAIHPNGLMHLVYPIKLLLRQLPGNAFAMGVSENISPIRTLFENPGSLAFMQLIPLLIVSLLWVWKLKENRRFLVFLPVMILGWLAERNLPILVLVILPMCIPESWFTRKADGIKWLGISIFLGFGVAQAQWWSTLPGPIAPFRFPEKASNWIQSQLTENVDGPQKVFCETRHGGYLSWRLFPKVHTYVDGRLILRNARFLQEYLKIQEDPNGFDHLDSLWQMDWVVLPTIYPPYLDKLAQYLRKKSNWSLVYLDENAWVFRKGNWPNQPSQEFVDSLLSTLEKEKP